MKTVTITRPVAKRDLGYDYPGTFSPGRTLQIGEDKLQTALDAGALLGYGNRGRSNAEGDCGCGKNGVMANKSLAAPAGKISINDIEPVRVIKLGGGWFEMPDGTKVQGLKNVPEHLRP